MSSNSELTSPIGKSGPQVGRREGVLEVRRKLIVFFSAVDLETGRGTENYLTQLILRGDANGFSVILVQPYGNAKITHRSVAGEANILRFTSWDASFAFMRESPFLQLPYELAIRPFLLWFRRHTDLRGLLSTLRDLRPTAVYLGFNEYLPLVSGLPSPIILSAHNLPSKSPLTTRILLKLWCQGLYYRSAGAFHLLPKYAEVADDAPVPTIILPGGANLGWHRDKTSSDPKVRVLYVGHLSREKGVPELLRICSRLPADKFHITIVGKGPMSASIIGWCKTRKNVTYLGFVPEELLASLYSNSDVFVYPSVQDTFGLVVSQALSSGLHVLTSTSLKGSFDEFEKEGFLSYLHPDALDRWLVQLDWVSDHLRDIRNASPRVRSLAAAYFDWDHIANEFYHWVADIAPMTRPGTVTSEG